MKYMQGTLSYGAFIGVYILFGMVPTIAAIVMEFLVSLMPFTSKLNRTYLRQK